METLMHPQHLGDFRSEGRPSCSSATRRRREFLVSRCKTKSDVALKEHKLVHVDYDSGKHEVLTEITGFMRDDIPLRRKLRVHCNDFQVDWTLSQVIQALLDAKDGSDIQPILDRWVGRFANRNFPFLIKELTKSGFVQLTTSVFSWMKRQLNYRARQDIYNMMIRMYARHNKINQSRAMFLEMQKWRCEPDVGTYNALILAHGRKGQWRWALQIIDDMLRSAVPPNRMTYNTVITACGSSGRWKEAMMLCEQMIKNGINPNLATHNRLLSAYKIGAQYCKCLSYFEMMKKASITPDTNTLNIVIDCHIKLGEYENALDIFNSMREKKMSCRPDVVTFTSIIHLYSLSGFVENCKAVFSTCISEGLRPNIVLYNTLIGSYASRGMSEEVLSLIDEMKRDGFYPDVVSFTSLLNAFGRSKNPEKAREVFDSMRREKCKPNIVTYNALINAYARNGLLEKGVDVLREMEKNRVKPDVVSICTLLAFCGNCCQRVNIDVILSAAKLRRIELNTVAYNSAICSYMNLGEDEKAFELYSYMGGRRAKPDSVTFTILISGCCKAFKFEKAIYFLDQMLNLNIPFSKELYSSAISAYGKQGRVGEAESMFSKMKMDGYIPDVVLHTIMIDMYDKNDDWEKVGQLYREMMAQKMKLDSIVCSAFMRAFNRGGQPSQVLSLAEFMKERKIPFNNVAFLNLVSACSMIGDWKTASNLIDVIDPSTFSVGIINHFLSFLGKSGKVDTMLKLFYKLMDTSPKVHSSTYLTLLGHLLATGNWRKCIQILEQMETSGISAPVRIYRNVMSFVEESGNIELAAKLRKNIEKLKEMDKF